ncbi:hypothetical protein [Metabacillus arenae]|uniref:DUF3311 domain-containing protein n=1 Tax=Metabacillus arenae TaxID=2771434 RepID=A0A926S2H8_9BACI|nr:hypothetical protein [Metabacillus arenae]MBD1382024.1 hypothetical protein [Metabacillus arenae]
MGNSEKGKKIVLLLIIFSLLMTATPIVILANKIQPFVLGIPFFAFWNIFWPFMLFVLVVVYSKIVDSKPDEQ